MKVQFEMGRFCMMKRVIHGAVSVALFTIGLGSTAFATAALELISGTDTIYVASGTGPFPEAATPVCMVGPTVVNCLTTFGATATNNQLGALTINAATFNGWDVTISEGGSNSPNCPVAGNNGPGCMDTTNINAENSGAGTLAAVFADTGFTPTGSTGLTVANTSALQTGFLETQQAYATAGTVNNLAPGSTLAADEAGLSTCGLALFSSPPGVTATPTGCVTPVAPFSLELATVFTTTAAGGFDVGGNISSIPEPAAVTLFGTLLAFCASGLRRRRKLSQEVRG
jgi:hypothetical protein